MNRDSLDWSDLKLFLAIYRRLSVRGASQNLGVSHSTVSRRLEKLEKTMGGVLFLRTPQGFTPSELAIQLLSRAERVETEIFGLERDLVGKDLELSGIVRVATTPIVSQELLIPLLATFSDLYPQIDLHLYSSYDLTDLASTQADIAIRFQDDPKPYLVGRRLPEFGECFYVAKSSLAKSFGDGPGPSLQVIGWSRAYDGTDWLKGTKYAKVPVRHDIYDLQDQIRAVKVGMGMAMLPCFVADPDPDLVRLPDLGIVRSRTAWILTHPDLRSSQRIQTCTGFLADALFQQKERITGRH
ncbi:MAG: LysR family transcriptional regulator [Roseibium sp.]